MSEIVIIGPDGNRFVFPAGTDRETMRAAMRRRYTGANARTREMIMTSQLPDPKLQGVRDYLGREQLIEDVRAGREVAELEAATGPENIAKERFYTAAQGQTLGAAPLLQGAVNVPIAAVMYPFLTEEEKAGRDFGQFVSEMSSLGYDQARGSISRAREKRPLESAGIELGAGFLTGKTVYDELGKRFLASRTGARGAAVGAGAGGQYGFLEGEGDVGQGLEGALMGAPLGAGLAKTFEAAAEPLGRMFAKGPLPEQTFPPYEEMIAAQAEKTSYQRTPEFQRIEGEINTAYDDIANTERTIATELRDMGYTWDGEEGDFMNVIDSLRREGRLGNYLASQVEDLRNASGRLFDAEDQMKAHLQEVASAPATAPQAEQMFANRNVTLSGASTAIPQAIVGGAGGSVLGSRTDLNGDGVIDEQDVFLGSAMGTVGVPAAMRAGRTVGRPRGTETRAMGAGGPETPQQAPKALPPPEQGRVRLFNVGTSDRDPGKYLQPHVSDWVNEVASGAGDFDDLSEITKPLIYLSDEPEKWLPMIVGRKIGKHPTEVTLDDIRQHGRLNVVDADPEYDTIYKVGDFSSDQKVTRLDGERVKWWETDLYDSDDFPEMPVGPEPNDFISREAAEISQSLTGDDLVEFMLASGFKDPAAKAPPLKPMGFGASTPKTPQQAARFETPGSPEYEAAVAKGLDMSTPARMARAKDMGFDTETMLYHGTPDASFEEFDPSLAGANQNFKKGQALPGMSFAYGPGAASVYAGGANRSPAIIPVFAKVKNPLDLRELGDFADQSFWDKLRASGVQTKKAKPVSAQAGKDYVTRIYEYLDAGGETLAKQIQDAGYDAIIYTEPASGKTLHIFDPSNIRSVNAAFDPDKAKSSTLLAAAPFAVGGAGLGVAADEEDR